METGGNPSAMVVTGKQKGSRQVGVPWHALSVADTTAAFDVDPSVGLDASTVSARQQEHGPNLLAEDGKEPAWRKILGLLADKMTLVLLAAAAVSAIVSREWETPISSTPPDCRLPSRP